MKKIILVMLVMVMTTALVACGDLSELSNIVNQVGEYADQIDKLQGNQNNDSDDDNDDYDYDDDYNDSDYSDNDDDYDNSDEDEEPVLAEGWWSKPYHLTATWNAAGIESANEEIDILYDGEELLIHYNDDGYYCRMKNGEIKNYLFDEKEKTNFVLTSSATSVQDDMMNYMAYTPSIIFYSRSVIEEAEYWKKDGTETIEGFKCDVYVQDNSMIQTVRLYIDKESGAMVRRETKYINEDEYRLNYQLHSFETKNVTTVSDIFNLDDYGGDPEELAEALAAKLRHPANGTILKESKLADNCILTMDWTIEEAKAYVEVIKADGFDQDQSSSDFETFFQYSAYNSTGEYISVNCSDLNGDKSGYVSITAAR